MNPFDEDASHLSSGNSEAPYYRHAQDSNLEDRPLSLNPFDDLLALEHVSSSTPKKQLVRQEAIAFSVVEEHDQSLNPFEDVDLNDNRAITWSEPKDKRQSIASFHQTFSVNDAEVLIEKLHDEDCRESPGQKIARRQKRKEKLRRMLSKVAVPLPQIRSSANARMLQGNDRRSTPDSFASTEIGDPPSWTRSTTTSTSFRQLSPPKKPPLNPVQIFMKRYLQSLNYMTPAEHLSVCVLYAVICLSGFGIFGWLLNSMYAFCPPATAFFSLPSNETMSLFYFGACLISQFVLLIPCYRKYESDMLHDLKVKHAQLLKTCQPFRIMLQTTDDPSPTTTTKAKNQTIWLLQILSALAILSGAIIIACGSLSFIFTPTKDSCLSYLWIATLGLGALLGFLQGCANAVLMVSILTALPGILCQRFARESMAQPPTQRASFPARSGGGNTSVADVVVERIMQLSLRLVVFIFVIFAGLGAISIRGFQAVVDFASTVEMQQLNVLRTFPIVIGSCVLFAGCITGVFIMVKKQHQNWRGTFVRLNPFTATAGTSRTSTADIELSNLDSSAHVSDSFSTEGSRSIISRHSSFWKVMGRLVVSVFLPSRLLTVFLFIFTFTMFDVGTWLLPELLHDTNGLNGTTDLHIGFQVVVLLVGTLASIMLFQRIIHVRPIPKQQDPSLQTPLHQLTIVPIILVFLYVYILIGFLAAWSAIYVLPFGTNIYFAYTGWFIVIAFGIVPATALTVGWILVDEVGTLLECWRLQYDDTPNSITQPSRSDLTMETSTGTLIETLVDIDLDGRTDSQSESTLKWDDPKTQLQDVVKSQKLFVSYSSSLAVTLLLTFLAWCMAGAGTPYLFKWSRWLTTILHQQGRWTLGLQQPSPWIEFFRNDPTSTINGTLTAMNDTLGSNIMKQSVSITQLVAIQVNPGPWQGNDALAILALAALCVFNMVLIVLLGRQKLGIRSCRLRVSEREGRNRANRSF